MSDFSDENPGTEKDEPTRSSLALELKCLQLKLKELEEISQARAALKVLVKYKYLTLEEAAQVFLGSGRFSL